jgi:alpha-L-fucosidase
MKIKILLLFLAAGTFAFGQYLPQGVTVDSVPCNYAPGYFNYNFLKNNELIGAIQPNSCYFSGVEEDNPTSYFLAAFYNAFKSDTFNTNNEAQIWILKVMEDYYKPVEVAKWLKLNCKTPEFNLEYPANWTYRTEKYDGIFDSKVVTDNKLVLMIEDQRGKSEVVMLIRTPNTAGLSTNQVIERNAMMNRAIDVKNNPAVDFVISGKTFKTAQNNFMLLMEQHHFWYADEKEIIYINYNLLKDERIRYPEVMKQIVKSISL